MCEHCNPSPIEVEEYKGFKIEIHSDEDPMDPRDCDNFGTLVCWHPRYTLGDKNEFATSDDFEEYRSITKLVCLPVFIIDHSGLAFNTGGFRYCDPQEWDSGQVGWIYITYDKLREEFGKKRITKALL